MNASNVDCFCLGLVVGMAALYFILVSTGFFSCDECQTIAPEHCLDEVCSYSDGDVSIVGCGAVDEYMQWLRDESVCEWDLWECNLRVDYYVGKSQLGGRFDELIQERDCPKCPECPKCPVCPVCPVCDSGLSVDDESEGGFDTYEYYYFKQKNTICDNLITFFSVSDECMFSTCINVCIESCPLFNSLDEYLVCTSFCNQFWTPDSKGFYECHRGEP